MRAVHSPPILSGREKEYLAFTHWKLKVEIYLEFIELGGTWEEPGSMAAKGLSDKESRKARAIMISALTDGALELATEGGDAAWEMSITLQDRNLQKRTVNLEQLWNQVYRKRVGPTESARGLVEWYDEQFAAFKEAQGVPLEDGEKTRILRDQRQGGAQRPPLHESEQHSGLEVEGSGYGHHQL
ncbi:hypothetical protein NDN08_000004 [Rhodosorus marinus]|uniref:Uncharacterized protein n=1 Tax=Rhodosorus marinus TaxID=101924 RepID=A0AAV8UGQ7_9RHOD|nr:hypothetical protein NDN08_000004 [Rhodosorus marinus]